MSFDPAPASWLNDYSNDAPSHTLAFSTSDAGGTPTLPQLTDAQADAVTGDIRAVMAAVMEAFYQAWLAQGADIPTKLRVSRSTSSTADGATLSYVYTIRAQVTLANGLPSLESE